MSDLSVREPTIIAESESSFLIVAKDHSLGLLPMTPAQRYDRIEGVLSQEVLPLAQWMKFLYDLDEASPIRPFTEDIKGGLGSGNFAHGGRVGHEGGSTSGGGHAALLSRYGVTARDVQENKHDTNSHIKRGEADLSRIEVDDKSLFETMEKKIDKGLVGSKLSDQIVGRLESSPESKAGLWASPNYGAVAKLQGFDGLPQVVSKERMDSLVAEGNQEIFRGVSERNKWTDGVATKVSAEENIEQFRSGPMFAGKGIYGNGLYAATERATALLYTQKFEENPIDPRGLARIALRKEARTITYEDAMKGLEAQEKSLPSTSREAFDRAVIRNDPGVWAASKGYDAIHVSSPLLYDKPTAPYVVILNRTAVYVEESQ